MQILLQKKRHVSLQVQVCPKTYCNQSCQTDLSNENNEFLLNESWLLEQNDDDNEWEMSKDEEDEEVEEVEKEYLERN